MMDPLLSLPSPPSLSPSLTASVSLENPDYRLSTIEGLESGKKRKTSQALSPDQRVWCCGDHRFLPPTPSCCFEPALVTHSLECEALSRREGPGLLSLSLRKQGAMSPTWSSPVTVYAWPLMRPKGVRASDSAAFLI